MPEKARYLARGSESGLCPPTSVMLLWKSGFTSRNKVSGYMTSVFNLQKKEPVLGIRR